MNSVRTFGNTVKVDNGYYEGVSGTVVKADRSEVTIELDSGNTLRFDSSDLGFVSSPWTHTLVYRNGQTDEGSFRTVHHAVVFAVDQNDISEEPGFDIVKLIDNLTGGTVWTAESL